jgi:hypothetical protein
LPTIRHKLTGSTFEVDKSPEHAYGTWECGNMRFTDPHGNLFEEIIKSAMSVPDFWKLFTLYEESLIRQAAIKDPVVEMWLKRIDDPRTTGIELGSEELQEFLARMVSMNLFKTERAEQIEAGVKQ